MAVRISQPRTDVEGLDELAPLWSELHGHHREVADYRTLVEDQDASWASRRRWYRRLLDEGGSYVIAADDDGSPIGYAMVSLESGPDDTFDVKGGLAEVVTLIVTRGQRGAGVGRALLASAEGIARARGFDTVKVAVMGGNAHARQFYEASGYSVAELVLYRRV
jgi:GNAT superfamily N-acetyltransferase